MNRIKLLRKEKKISQVKLAEVLGVHQTAISQWETGRTNPDLDSAKKLAAYFNVTLDYLLAGEEFRNPALPTSAATEEERAGMLPAIRHRFPLLGDIACGEPIFADEDKEPQATEETPTVAVAVEPPQMEPAEEPPAEPSEMISEPEGEPEPEEPPEP